MYFGGQTCCLRQAKSYSVMYNHKRNPAPKVPFLSWSFKSQSACPTPPAHHPGALPLIFFFTFLSLQVVWLCLVLLYWFLWCLCASVLLCHMKAYKRMHNYRKYFCSLFPYWRNCFVFILEGEGWHLQWDVVLGVGGVQKWFRKVRLVLGRQEKGRAQCGRGLMPVPWHRRQWAPGIWCKTTCKNVGASEQIQFLSFSEVTPAEGGLFACVHGALVILQE